MNMNVYGIVLRHQLFWVHAGTQPPSGSFKMRGFISNVAQVINFM